MKFDTDERQDQISNLRQLYSNQGLSKDDKQKIQNLIKDIDSGKTEFDNQKNPWENFYNFIYKTEAA